MIVKVVESNGLYTIVEHNKKQYMADTTFNMLKWEKGEKVGIGNKVFKIHFWLI
jgi:hypothetical protein